MSASEFPETPTPLPQGSGRPPRPPKITARGLLDAPGNDESLVEEIARRMAGRFPHARVRRSENFIAFFPDDPGGFVVWLVVRGTPKKIYTVHYSGSAQVFTDRGSARDQFAFGLSNHCRVREYSHSGKPYRWLVEIWDDPNQRWHADWDDIRWSAALRMFWRRPTIRTLQNRLIDCDSSDLSRAA